MVVLTHFPSPYQVELFDEIERQAPGRLKVLYLHACSPGRQWTSADLSHRARFLEHDWPDAASVAELCDTSQLVIFNFYNDSRALELLNRRARSGRTWCFWGERPGFISPLLGRVARLWRLRALHRSRAAIWGIGQMAVDAYKREFGDHRAYVNLPYFSNLERFGTTAKAREGAPRSAGERVSLFSGALIRRKGGDLLAQAFARVADEVPAGRLVIMGAGELEPSLKAGLSRQRHRVQFLGFQDWKNLHEIYSKADILCVPSRHDGWGLVVPEGLASGLPVISTTATGSAVEFVKNGTNGWLIPGSDLEALCLSMKEALTLPEEHLATMSKAARGSVEGHQLKMGAQRFLAAAEQALQNW
jgi:glycosyltransferase involved in cell wall biosynthesis